MLAEFSLVWIKIVETLPIKKAPGSEARPSMGVPEIKTKLQRYDADISMCI